MTARFVEKSQIVSGVVPVNLATAANDGDWVSLKDYGKLTVVFFKGAGAAGEDPTLTMEQAKDVSGTGAKALDFTDIYTKQGSDLATIGQFTKVTQTAANTYTEATSGEEEAIWVVEFNAEDLDVSNGFACIRARVASVGATSQIGTILYLLGDARYPQEALPSAIAD